MAAEQTPSVRETGYSAIWIWWTIGSILSVFGLGCVLAFLVKAQSRVSQATLLAHLHDVYSTPEMYDAIQTVLEWKPDESGQDSGKQKHRRAVLHFLELLGTIVRFEVIDERLLRDRFRDQVSIWEKLHPIQMRMQEKIVRERQPNLAESDIAWLAKMDVETSAAHWLYLRWCDVRRASWRISGA